MTRALAKTGPASTEIRVECVGCGKVRYYFPSEIKRMMKPYRCRQCQKKGNRYAAKEKGKPRSLPFP